MSDQGKKLYCMICGRYVGIIRDGRLMKGLQFVCRPCAVIGQDASRAVNEPDGGPVVDFLKGFFK